MKKENFLMLAFVAVASVAYNNENLIPIGNPDDDNQSMIDPTGDTWVALAAKTPVQTRGLHNPNQEAATEDRSKITTVRAIFFTANANEGAATVTADLTLDSDKVGLDANGIPSGATDKAFKVPTTSRRILIIANPSPKFKAKTASETDQKWSVGTTYTTVSVTLDDTLASMTTAGKFVISNAKGPLEPSDEDEASGTFGAPVDSALHATETAATNNPISTRISRVVSGVRVYVTADSDAKATISDAGWISNTINKTFFPVSKRALAWNETPANRPLGARDTCITPFDQYRTGSYRVDPNYSTRALANYNAHANTSAPSIWNDPAITMSKVAEYRLESTQTTTHNVHAYTAHMLSKAKFVPSKYGRPAPNDDAPSTAQETDPKSVGGWMLIDGGFYTFTTLMEWIEAELRVKYTDKRPTTFPTVRTIAYNRYLAAIGVDETSLLATADATAITSLVDDFKATKANVGDVAAKDKAITITGLTYYVGTVSCCKIMAKHDNTNAVTNESGEFGVVHSSVCDINAKKFNNPEYPTIPDPDEGTPGESDEGWLFVEIIPNPWTWYTQEEIM